MPSGPFIQALDEREAAWAKARTTSDEVLIAWLATATETERVPFDRVAKVEHVMGGEKAMFEVVAVTNDGKRYIIKRSEEKPMQGHAEHVASVIGKPMEEVRNIKTFGD